MDTLENIVNALREKEIKLNQHLPHIYIAGSVLGGISGGIIGHYLTTNYGAVPELAGIFTGSYLGLLAAIKLFDDLQEEIERKIQNKGEEPEWGYYDDF